jgi:hypothetical protein
VRRAIARGLARRALAPAALAAALAAPACGGGDDGDARALQPAAGAPGASGGGPGVPGGGAGAGPAGSPGSAGSSDTAGGGGGGDVGGGDVGGGGSGGDGPGGAAGAGGVAVPEPQWYECQASDQAFVRRAYLAVLGRRPSGQAEVTYYADLVRAVDAAENVDPAAPYDPAAPRPSRAALIDALADANGDAYVARWADAYLDALRVQRVDELANPGCFNDTWHPRPRELVELVRDGDPQVAAATQPFTMLDLVRGALLADDLSAPYVGNLFAMLTRSYGGANVDRVELELSRRSDFGAWFNAAYLHRDVVCLGCHNSEFSVTQTDDPATNRHFPVPALLEKALFGTSFGPPAKDGYDGPTRAFAVLRFDGFSASFGGQDEGGFGGVRPWNWSSECGTFNPDPGEDPARVDAQFGPLTGTRVTAFDTARLLQQGVRELRERGGLVVGPGGDVQSPAMAFAYLVAMNVAERTWREVVGTPLTIPLYFPRNAAARDELARLTDAFVAGGFSHRALLKAVVTSPAFNLAPPDDACWRRAYPAPPIFDPWTTGDPDEARRGNGPADAVAPLSSRTLVRALSSALEWPNPLPSFPGGLAQVSSELGLFLHNAEPGFRGFDFQARLSWELAFGACRHPFVGPATDFVDALKARADAASGSTARDLVAALKDRLVGEPSIADGPERAALEALLGATLDAPAASIDETALRAVCGAIASSPQMLLSGLPAPDGAAPPALTAPEDGYGALCERLAGVTFGEYTLGCDGGAVAVTKGPAPFGPAVLRKP